jgi:hypothetical protein
MPGIIEQPATTNAASEQRNRYQRQAFHFTPPLGSRQDAGGRGHSTRGNIDVNMKSRFAVRHESG